MGCAYRVVIPLLEHKDDGTTPLKELFPRFLQDNQTECMRIEEEETVYNDR